MGVVTSEEFRNIIKILKTVYTAPNFIPDNFSAKTWFRLLGDYEYQSLILACETYMRSNKFPPTPADIIDCIAKQSPANNYLTGQEAWGLVAKACRNGIYGSEEEFHKLPELVQKAVGSASQIRAWAMTEIESFNTVIQSNFLRSYSAAVKADTEYKKYPERLKQLVGSTSQGLLEAERN